MLDNLSNQISSTLTNLNPMNWSPKTKTNLLYAGVSMVALYTLANLPMAAAMSDAEYNLLRSAQTGFDQAASCGVQQGVSAGINHALTGSLLGAEVADGIKAATTALNNNANPVIATVSGLATAWQSSQYRSCLDECEGLWCLFCHLIRP